MKAESFGYKNAWIAVKGASPEAAAKALVLRNVRSCTWEAGIKAAYAYPMTSRVFVTPVIDGWVLCVGFPLFAPVDARPPVFGRRAAEWASALGTEVQYFSTHRVVEAHGWARARPAGLERAYSFVGESGEKTIDDGSPTAEERELGFAFFDPESDEAENDGYWEREDLTSVTEGHVMALAARWSIDPSSVDERSFDVGDGLLGEFGEPPAPPTRATAIAEPPRPWWKFW